jgi:hypothetical protein
MGALFSSPKPPKPPVVPEAKETPPPIPPAVPPALPPPAKDAPVVQGADSEVRRKERRRGRVQTILTSPMGVVSPGKDKLGV